MKSDLFTASSLCNQSDTLEMFRNWLQFSCVITHICMLHTFRSCVCVFGTNTHTHMKHAVPLRIKVPGVQLYCLPIIIYLTPENHACTWVVYLFECPCDCSLRRFDGSRPLAGGTEHEPTRTSIRRVRLDMLSYRKSAQHPGARISRLEPNVHNLGAWCLQISDDRIARTRECAST